jgi:transposase InsO family protein
MPDPYKIATWRFEQIAPLVDSTLDRAARRHVMRERSAKATTWPDGAKKRIPKSTLHRWLESYKRAGLPGLMPQARNDHGKSRKGHSHHVDYAIGLLLEQHGRSLQQLDVYLHAQFADYALSLATLRRRLVAHPAYAAVERLRTGKARRLRGLYEAAHPHECWQLDGKGPFVVTLASHERVHAHVLSVLDDHSRAVLAAHVASSEDTVAAITAFAKAASRYGLPDRMQFDRGSAFDSESFRDGIAHCGVHRNYVRARHPQAQGKIEAYHRSLGRWFVDELRAQEVHGLAHLQELLDATIALVYQKHRHRSIGMSPDERLGRRVSARQISAADLARAFYVGTTAHSDPKTGEVQLPNGRFRVPVAYAGKRAAFRYDPLRPVAVLLTTDRREIALAPFLVKPLPAVDPKRLERGSGRLQKLVDDWRGTPRVNAEPAFGIPEVFAALAELLGRSVPTSEREAQEVQSFWKTYGPIRRQPFRHACARTKAALGEGRPLATYLVDIGRQIADDSADRKEGEA